MSNKLVIMEDETLNIITKRLDKLTDEVKQINTQHKSGFKEHWLTSNEVCKILDVSKRTLQEMRKQDTIQFSKIGNKLFYKASDIEFLLEENYNLPTDIRRIKL